METARKKAHTKEREKKREIINAAKNVPCADCGMRYPPQVMQFDHVRGEKRFNIGRGIGGIAGLKDEISKCEVVCSNCHALRTWPE